MKLTISCEWRVTHASLMGRNSTYRSLLTHCAVYCYRRTRHSAVGDNPDVSCGTLTAETTRYNRTYILVILSHFQSAKISNFHHKFLKAQTLIDASKEVGLEVNTERNKYMLLSRHQNAGKNIYIKICKRWFENVPQFRYLGTMITNQNLIHEEIKRRLNSGSICYHSVRTFVLSYAV
jgi:hypothetical protein